MLLILLTFIFSLLVLLFSSRKFTAASVKLGAWMKLPPFVIGIFIVGIGTSLPELISGIFSVSAGQSEILSGNLLGANISNLLLVTGLAVTFNRRDISIGSQYIYTDLHFLIGGFFVFYLFAFDGDIKLAEGAFGIVLYLIYSFYLIRGESGPGHEEHAVEVESFPAKSLLILCVSCIGIWIGADYTVSSLSELAQRLSVPSSLISLTLLSLGTTLPELAVNISAIRQGTPELAIGNVLGSCVFNITVIPFVAGLFGTIEIPGQLASFSLPVMVGCGLLFYLLTHDKRISPWEGALFVLLYFAVISRTVFDTLMK